MTSDFFDSPAESGDHESMTVVCLFRLNVCKSGFPLFYKGRENSLQCLVLDTVHDMQGPLATNHFIEVTTNITSGPYSPMADRSYLFCRLVNIKRDVHAGGQQFHVERDGPSSLLWTVSQPFHCHLKHGENRFPFACIRGGGDSPLMLSKAWTLIGCVRFPHPSVFHVSTQ